jgi:hypothetical protein
MPIGKSMRAGFPRPLLRAIAPASWLRSHICVRYPLVGLRDKDPDVLSKTCIRVQKGKHLYAYSPNSHISFSVSYSFHMCAVLTSICLIHSGHNGERASQLAGEINHFGAHNVHFANHFRAPANYFFLNCS